MGIDNIIKRDGLAPQGYPDPPFKGREEREWEKGGEGEKEKVIGKTKGDGKGEGENGSR